MHDIVLRNLSKKYRVFFEKSSITKSVLAFARRKRIYEDVWALRDVSMVVEKGETVGVIGRNGSGKSTLLKVLAGVTRADGGEIEVSGQVSALIELGAGFQGELTGRENVFLNAAILGLSRSAIEKKFDRIVDFAELDKFIDAPLQTYSSGMHMRLGFSVAIHVDFNVLLIDEILAVGDALFQAKCFEKFHELKDRGATIVFVSHDLTGVRQICNRTLLLDGGCQKMFGTTDEVVDLYLGDLENERHDQEVTGAEPPPPEGKKWGSKLIRITDVRITKGNGVECRKFAAGGSFTAEIAYSCDAPLPRAVFGIGIHRRDGLHICGPNTKAYGLDLVDLSGDGSVRFEVASLPLLEGNYELSASIYDEDILHSYDHHDKAYKFEVTGSKPEEKYGTIRMPGRWVRVK